MPDGPGILLSVREDMTITTPKPKDGELQSDFAIRFHESMMDAVPNTDERNQMCFGAWRDSVGDEPEVETARKYHKASEFDERRDIPVFEEHVIPERLSKDGKRKIPAVKYDRKALAAICRNMNEAIADVGKFCPITNGHTSDNVTDPEPEVLAFTGAYRLGMIGNNKPRYAIFADEYHRKDRAEILKGRRGRSVEVLPLPDVSKRSFYPIAALGADEPRLNLPPARYQKVDGEEIEVERYMMVAPGGASTFIPDADKQKYGDDQQSEMPIPLASLKQIMEAFTQTAVFQWAVGKMEEEGKSGAVNPLVHQPPQMADMPVDDAAGQPGAQPPMPGQEPDQDDMGDGDVPDEDWSEDDELVSGPIGPNTPEQGAAGGSNKPPFKGNEKMTEQTPAKPDQYSQKSAGLQALEDRIAAVEAENAGLRAKLIGAERYSKLSSLKSQGVELDMDSELKKVATQSDEQFAGHVETIEKYYRRSPAAVADFSELHGAGRQSRVADGPANEIDTLKPEEVNEVIKYAEKHRLEYTDARERYAKEKTVKTPVAG